MKHHLVDLYQVCSNYAQIMLLGQKIAPPRGHKFYIRLYRENMEKYSCL